MDADVVTDTIANGNPQILFPTKLHSHIQYTADNEIITAQFVLVDRVLAQRLLTLLYEGQRKLRRWHVEELTNIIARGQFRNGSVVEFIHWNENKSWHGVDGQHTLNAIIASDRPTPLLIVYRHVQTFEQLAQIYASFGRELKRTPADVMMGMGIANRWQMTPKELDTFYAVVKYPLNNFHHLSVTTNPTVVSDALYIIEQMEAAAELYLECVSAAKDPALKRALRKVPAMAIGLATLIGPSHEAREFWQSVAEDDGLRQGDPRKALVTYLTRTRDLGASPLTSIRTIAPCWNAFCRRRKYRTANAQFNGYMGVTIDRTPFRAIKPSGKPKAEDDLADEAAE